MIKSHDVVIVGGGPIGAACARELARRGRSVLVLDSDATAGAAWRASAGMLAPQIDGHEDYPLFQLGIAGREYYRDHATELEAETGIQIGLVARGIIHLARGSEEESRLRSSVAWQRQHGHRVEWLEPEEVRRQFPWVGDSDGALWAPDDGSVDPVLLVAALRASAARHGAKFVAESVIGIRIESNRATALRTSTGELAAGDVVLAAGAWTGGLHGLPRHLPVEPVRGQMVAKHWPARVPPSIVYGAHGYVLERNHEALCGATIEHAGFNPEITEAGGRDVIAATATLLPALASLAPLRRWAGLRPGTPDGLPIIGPEPTVPNLWYATGHGRNGILFAGITGVILTHLLGGESSFEELALLRPERFGS